MKSSLLFLLGLFLSLHARENPFEPVYNTPQNTNERIPLLEIHTNAVFKEEPTHLDIIKNTFHQSHQVKINLEQNDTIKPKTVSISTKVATPIMIKKNKIATRKIIKSSTYYKTIYQNYFLKLQANNKNIKIITKDCLLSQKKFYHPSRLAFDFTRLQYFHTKTLNLNKPYAKRIKLGSHHEFYRITVELNRYRHYKIHKKPYGYLLTFY